MKTTQTLSLLAIAGLGSLGATILQARAASPSTAKSAGAPVTSAGIAAEGRVVAYPGAEVTVGADAIGRLVRVNVEENDRVRRGQTLAEIDASDLIAARDEATAQLDEAIAELKLAEANARRKEQLFEQKIVPAFDRDQALRDVETSRARIETSRATIRRYDATIAKTRLVSPIDGVVTSRIVHPGQMIERGDPAFVVADLNRLRIEGEAHEADAGAVAKGDRVEIRSDGSPGEVFEGRIEEVPTSVTLRRIKPQDPARPTDARVLAVKVAFAGPNPLKLGATVDLTIVPARR